MENEAGVGERDWVVIVGWPWMGLALGILRSLGKGCAGIVAGVGVAPRVLTGHGGETLQGEVKDKLSAASFSPRGVCF